MTRGRIGAARPQAFRGVLIALGARSYARSEAVSRWTRVGAFPSLTLVDVTSQQVGEIGILGVSPRTNHRDRPQTDESITATTTSRYGTSDLADPIRPCGVHSASAQPHFASG